MTAPDFDAVAAWELQNLGFGNHAMRRQRASQNRQAQLTGAQIRDAIAAEVSQAFYQVRYRREQIGVARDQVRAAAEALELNFRGIRGGELRAIEAQQAVEALAAARTAYIETVVAYDEAQFALLRAVGQPPYAPGAISESASPSVAN